MVAGWLGEVAGTPWRTAARRHPPAALLTVLAALSLLASLAPGSSRPLTPLRFASSQTPGDQSLYMAVTAAISAGAPYYPTVVRLQRERGYPLRPFVTVRPPTLAIVSATLGPTGTFALALGLIASNAIAWYVRLRGGPAIVRFGALGLLSAIGAAGISPEVLAAHEWWSGLLLSLALALGPERWFAAAVACGVAAALVRELATGFLVVLLAHELLRAAWRRAAVLVGVLLGLAVLLLLHRAAILDLTTPGDRASPGWLDWRGPAGFASDLVVFLNWTWLPRPLTLFVAFSPLVGWALAPPAAGRLPLAWFACFALAEGFIARADNWYWVQLLMPAYLLGWLFLATQFQLRMTAA